MQCTVTLRSADYSSPTQDSLPAAGQALPDGLLARKIPLKGFKVLPYISSSFPKLLGTLTPSFVATDEVKARRG
jgi:hypothetical protein